MTTTGLAFERHASHPMTTTEHHAQITAEEIAHTFEEGEHAPVDLSIYALEDWLTFGLFWAMTVSVFLQFFTRYVLNDSLAWTEEIATYCNVAIVFLGSAMCVRLNRHIQVDFLYRYLPRAPARGLATLIDLVRIAFFGYAAWLVWKFMSIISGEEMTTVQLPKNLFYGCLRADVPARDPGRARQLAARIFGARAARGLRARARRLKPCSSSSAPSSR
jgi:TRAP-type C4-dicarboxylate transport system permease small subunit